MNGYKKEPDGFIGYEYSDVTVAQSMESVYIDGYQNFGWELDSTSAPIGGISSVILKFKRDRSKRKMAEVTRLQRQFDACVSDILSLERSKSLNASVAAYIIGLIGTAFMAVAVFAYLANLITLTIVLAVPGIVGWIIPYFCFAAIVRKKTAQLDPLIDQKYDEIYTVCERANSLINTI